MGSAKSKRIGSVSQSSDKDENRRVWIHASYWDGPSLIPKFWQGSKKKRWKLYKNNKHLKNDIKTAKYGITFPFVNLFYQFQKLANAYFLFTLILQCIDIISSVSPVGTALPLFIVLSVTMVKDGYDDIQRHKQDRRLNNKKSQKLTPSGDVVEIAWQDVMTGNLIKVQKDESIPADLVLLSSTDDEGLAFLETAELDGETNLKIKTSIRDTNDSMNLTQWYENDFGNLVKFIDQTTIECDAPNVRLGKFSGTLYVNEGTQNETKYSLDNDNVLLRGTVLRNCDAVVGVCVYAGAETKLMKNGGEARFKRTHMDYMMNTIVLAIFAILAVCCCLAMGLHIWFETTIGFFFQDYLEWQKPNPDKEWSPTKSGLLVFWSYFILLNTLVPISLYVSVEMIRLGQSLFIDWDRGMYYSPTDKPALARSTTLNEELGQVKYVFSDKTGTLTQNIMEFKKCAVGGVTYGYDEGDISFKWNKFYDNSFTFTDERIVSQLRDGYPEMERFLKILALNHTVMPEFAEINLLDSDNQSQSTPEGSVMKYQAQSPDEAALVTAARCFGYVFTGRTNDTITVNRLGEEVTYNVLHIADFDNDRKRMSIVVQEQDGIFCYTKGADTTVMEVLSPDNDPDVVHATQASLNAFAEEGLRTLLLGYRKISAQEWTEWEESYHQASTDMDHRDELISKCHLQLEKDIHLAGVTAIEDKLQVGVPQTIKKILKGGIKLWVLTGDKLETAINIGYSCNLLTNDMREVYPISTEDTEKLEAELLQIKRDVKKQRDKEASEAHDKGSEVTEATYGLVITGGSLQYALNEHRSLFLEVSKICQSVICCRVTPLQKAEVVELIKKSEKCVTLAIGDGANDVSMIKAAHLGIGISGLEGTQAVLASDFAFSQFRYLERLLFIHGRYSYYRMSIFLEYFLLKNFAFTFSQFWYGIYCMYSALSVYDDMMIGVFNVVYTSLPPIVLAMFDKDVNERTSLRYPELYKPGQDSTLFNMKIFIWVLFRGLVISIFIFFMTYLTMNEMEQRNGIPIDYQTFQVTLQTQVVLTMTVEMCFVTRNWTLINTAVLSATTIAFFIFSGAFYSHGAYTFSPTTFKLMGVVPHVWAEPTPWLNILATLAIYLIVLLASRFVKYLMYPSMQDKFMVIQAKEKAELKEQSLLKTTKFTRKGSNRSQTKVKSGYAFSVADNQKAGELIQQGTLRGTSMRSYRSPHIRKTRGRLGTPLQQQKQSIIRKELSKQATLDSMDSAASGPIQL